MAQEFTEDMRARVFRFQQATKMPQPTGVVDAATWTTLFDAYQAKASTTEKPDERPAVKTQSLGEFLRSQGFTFKDHRWHGLALGLTADEAGGNEFLSRVPAYTELVAALRDVQAFLSELTEATPLEPAKE